ncbi:MAG: FIST signal transduction protein [Marinifilaceae bacterium]
MIIHFIASNSVLELIECLNKIDQNKHIRSVLVLSCEKNGFTPDQLDPCLTQLSLTVFGGLFPAIIYGNQKYEKGTLIVGFEEVFNVKLIENLSKPNQNLEEVLLSDFAVSDQLQTMFVFVDGFAKKINAFIESLFITRGLQYNYIGGGAGSLCLQQQPCIISNKGLTRDSAIIAETPLNSGIGVKHGWETISNQFKVTAAENTIIKELNFQPAFSVYKKTVENHSGKNLSHDNFFRIAKAYPFGIDKIDAEKVVRDPLQIGDNGSLVCVGEVASGSFLSILSGNKDSLINAAIEAVEASRLNKKGNPDKFIFLVDCISRVLFLQEEFPKELEAVFSQCNSLPLIGVLSIGEIANNGKDYLEFYNKTAVIGCF